MARQVNKGPHERDGWHFLTGDQADGLAVIPEDCDHLPAGAAVQVILLD